MVTENLLALLWVVLLGIAGLGKMSDKRHGDALKNIHCALTDADRTNIAALLHGQTDPYEALIPNDAKGADSAGTTSIDSDSDSGSGSSSGCGSGRGSGSGSDSPSAAPLVPDSEPARPPPIKPAATRRAMG